MAKRTTSSSTGNASPTPPGAPVPPARATRARSRTPKSAQPLDSVTTGEARRSGPASAAPNRAEASDVQIAAADDKTTSVSMASEPSEEDIRRRAYQMYLDRGGDHGGDFDDWLRAEEELRKTR
jgi:hypothetical protein